MKKLMGVVGCLLSLSTLASDWSFRVDGGEGYIKVGQCAVEYREVQRTRYISLRNIVVIEKISASKIVMFDATGNGVFSTPVFLGREANREFADALIDEWYACQQR